LPSRIWDNLDRILAWIGLFASIALAFLLYWFAGGRFAEVGGLLFIACAAYLLIGKRRATTRPPLSSPLPEKATSFAALAVLFFVVLSLSLCSIALRAELYDRPLGYFIATAVMCGILAGEIVLAPTKKSYTYFILFQIIILGLSLRFIPQLLFPDVIGMDPWDHWALTDLTLESGYLPDSASWVYGKMPIMHLIIGMTELVTGLDYPLANMFSISLVHVIILPLYTFLLGAFLGKPKVGLLGALLILVVPHIALTGFSIFPNGLGLLWLLIIIYLLFRQSEERTMALQCMTLIFMGVLIMTHTVTSVVMASIIFFFWAAHYIYQMTSKNKIQTANPNPIGWTLLIIAPVTIIAWWMFPQTR